MDNKVFHPLPLPASRRGSVICIFYLDGNLSVLLVWNDRNVPVVLKS